MTYEAKNDRKLLIVRNRCVTSVIYDEKEEAAKFRRDVCLKDQDGDVFYDKLHFKFLQMPLFKKQADELETHFDKWVYFLKNLENLDHLPAILNEPIFQKGFEIAELSHLKPKQFDDYQKSLLEYWELKNVKDTAFGEGKMEGLMEGEYKGIKKIAQSLKDKQVAMALIIETTGLNREEIENL